MDTAPAATHDTRRRRLAAIGLLALLFVLLLLLWDWNWFKGPVERHVEAATGREFSIEGDLDVELSLTRPTIIAHGVVLGNPDWAGEREMIRVDQARIQWAIWKLWGGDVVLPRVELEKPRLWLERGADGQANWTFSDEPADDTVPTNYPDIGELLVRDGRFRLVEPSLKTDIDVAVRSDESASEGRAPLLLAGTGRYRDAEFELDGRIDSPLELIDAEDRFVIDLRARAGATRAHASGGLATPLQLQDFDLAFELSGADMAQLYPLLGLAIPRTPPYRLKGRLGRTGEVWSYREFTGIVGDSDLAGNASVDPSRERTFLKADLVSQRLDLDDLAGFIGGTPQAGEGSGTPVAAQASAPDRIFPTREYDVGRLRSMDADVTLKARRINSPGLPVEAMTAHLMLEDGDLRLDPLDFAVAGGDIASRVRLDARQTPIAASIDVRARGLELPKLAPEGAPESTGRIGGRIQVAGRGNSVAALMDTADGELQLGMGRGQISNLMLELAGLDIYEALRFLIGKDRVVPIRCAYADFKVEDGVATSRAFAFDTTDTVLLAEGSIDLGEERLDLRLNPRPKDPSPLSLRSPLRVRGPIKDPTVRPEGGPLILRTAIAAALYTVAPPAAILALIETGPGEDTACGADNPRVAKRTPADDDAGPGRDEADAKP